MYFMAKLVKRVSVFFEQARKMVVHWPTLVVGDEDDFREDDVDSAACQQLGCAPQHSQLCALHIHLQDMDAFDARC